MRSSHAPCKIRNNNSSRQHEILVRNRQFLPLPKSCCSNSAYAAIVCNTDEEFHPVTNERRVSCKFNQRIVPEFSRHCIVHPQSNNSLVPSMPSKQFSPDKHWQSNVRRNEHSLKKSRLLRSWSSWERERERERERDRETERQREREHSFKTARKAMAAKAWLT